MKKKIIFTSVIAIIVFIFWIVDDVKREVESALNKYGVEFSGCSFVYPYLKFETLQYGDLYAYDVKLNMCKFIKIDELSISSLKYYPRLSSNTDYARYKIEKRKISDLYKKIVFVAAKYFNDFRFNYFAPKNITVKNIELENLLIKDVDISLDEKKINAYFAINNTDFSVAGTKILGTKTTVQLKFRSDLKTNIILRSDDNILNFVAQSTIVENGALKFFGDISINNYDKVNYEFFVDDEKETALLEFVSKFGKLRLNLNCNSPEMIVGEYSSEFTNTCHFKLLTHNNEQVTGNNLGKIFAKIRSNLKDSELFIDYKDSHIKFVMNFIKDFFDLKFWDETNNIAVVLNKKVVDVDADTQFGHAKAHANLNEDLNTLTFNKILISASNLSFKSSYAICKVQDSNFTFNIPKIKLNNTRSLISFILKINNNFNSDILCKVQNLNLYNNIISGILNVLINNENISINSNLKTDTGFKLLAKTKDFVTNFKLLKNKSFIDISIPKKITIENLSDIFLKENFLIKSHLNLTDFSNIISSGCVDIDLDLLDKNDIKGFIKANKINIKDYKRGVILKDISLNFTGRKGAFNCNKSQIFDIDDKKSSLTGSLIIRGLPDISLDAKLPIDNFCLVNGASLRLNCTGPLYVKGDLKSGFDITGNLVTDTADFNLLDMTNDYKNVVFNHKNSPQLPENNFLKDKLRFNIELNSDNLLIHNKILYVPLTGKLFLVGNGMTSLKGNMEVLSNGYMMMFKKKLDIKVGKISFLEEYPFEAFFTLRATQIVSDIKLVIDINKTIGDFNYKFYSIPRMSEDKLLAKILFNKDVDELTPLDWVQIAYVLKSVDENSIFSDIDNITQKVGIDEIRIEQQNAKESGTIKIGKNLSKGLSLSVENDIDNNVQKVRLRKQLSKLFSFDITTDGEVGVLYKYKY